MGDSFTLVNDSSLEIAHDPRVVVEEGVAGTKDSKGKTKRALVGSKSSEGITYKNRRRNALKVNSKDVVELAGNEVEVRLNRVSYCAKCSQCNEGIMGEESRNVMKTKSKRGMSNVISFKKRKSSKLEEQSDVRVEAVDAL